VDGKLLTVEVTGNNSTATTNTIRRVVILGHNGFIGGNLFRTFLAQPPNIEVIGRDFPDLDLIDPEQALRLSEIFDLDTAVIICAAIKRQLGDNLDAFSSNLQIATNLSRVLAEHPVGRVVFFSSAAVYGEECSNTSITEATPAQPMSYYGLAKFTSEFLLRKAVETSPQSSLLILRPALVYGPGDQGGYGPTGFVKAALNREPIVLWGDGSEKREFVFVTDVARIVLALTFHKFDGILNVVSGKSYTFQDAVETVARLLPLEQPVGTKPRSKAKADHGFDNSRLRELLPRFQFTELAEGIRLTLESNRNKPIS
jgi:UDP-glucose 4-epimerase